MPVRPPRWLRSVRRRPIAFVALVLLSAFTVIVSALTPMLLAAVAAEGLAERVAALGPPDGGLAVFAQASSPDLIATAQSAADNALLAVHGTVWGHAHTVTVTSDHITWRRLGATKGGERTQISIASDCGALRFTQGRCPNSITELAIPASAAAASGLVVGKEAQLQESTETPKPVLVVGVYDDGSGEGRRLANPDAFVGDGLAHPVANPIIGTKQLNTIDYRTIVEGFVPIARRVTATDLPDLRDGVANAKQSALSTDAAATSAQVVTNLVPILASIAKQQAAAVTLATPVALEALALAWFALAYVSQRTARARATEWGIDRTRGLRRSTWLATVFLEPVIAIVLGALLGFGAAVLVAAGATRVALGDRIAVEPFAPFVLAAAALALLGSLVGLVIASARSIALPLDALLRETTEPRRISRLALVGQVAAVLVAAAVLLSVLTTRLSSGPQLALALPVLLALVAGTVALRVTVVVVRRAAGRLPRSLVALVAGRGLARAPSALTAAVLLLVAAALAGYSLQLDAVSTRTQDDRADLAVGAATVDTVSVPAGTSLLAAVQKADPSGTTALAAEEVDTPGASGVNRVVAVDTARIDAVSTWKRQWQGVPLSRLRPADTRDLVLRGRRLTVGLDAVGNGDQLHLPADRRLELSVVLARASGWTTVQVGVVSEGATLSATIPCADGCRLVSLDLNDEYAAFPTPWGAVVDIRSIATDTQPARTLALWLEPGRWRNRIADSTDPSLPVKVDPSQVADELELDAQDTSGQLTAELEPASGPVALPAIPSSSTPTNRYAGVPKVVYGSDLSGAPLLLSVEGRAPAIPRSLTDGVLVDLGQIGRYADPSLGTPTEEVWLAPGSHPAVLASLRAQGVRILSSRTAASARAAAQRSIVPRSIGLVRITAIASIVLALLALAAGWVIDAPLRRREWLALRLSGVPPTALRRIAIARFLAPNAVAVVLGVPVAILTFAITVRQLPLLAGVSAGPPVDGTAPWAEMGLLALGLIVVAALIGVVGARIELPRRVVR